MGGQPRTDASARLALRSAIGQRIGAFLLCAVRATLDDVSLLNAMPDYADSAMGADGSKLLDRATAARLIMEVSQRMGDGR